MTKHLSLRKLKPCKELLEYAESYDSLQEAWDNCERGDWMLWLAGILSGEPGSKKRKKLATCACVCVRLPLPYVQEGKLQILENIDIVESWAKDKGKTLDDVQAYADAADSYAAYAAYAADAVYAYAADAADAADAYAAYAAYAAGAAYAYAADAADAADVADAYADVAVYAAAAVAYAAYAAYATADVAVAVAAYAAAREKTLKKCADIVRKFYPEVPLLSD